MQQVTLRDINDKIAKANLQIFVLGGPNVHNGRVG